MQVWDTDPDTLPPKGVLFQIISQGDTLFERHDCPCGCQRPVVINYVEGVTDDLFTLLARGDDTGIDDEDELASAIASAIVDQHPELIDQLNDQAEEEFIIEEILEDINLKVGRPPFSLN